MSRESPAPSAAATAAPSGDRRAKLQDFKRAEILAAARRVLEAGPEGSFSLRAIAKEADYAPAALYSYFANIDGLMVAVAGEGCAALARRLKSANEGGAAPPARLAALIEAACDAGGTSPLEAPLLAALLDPARRNRDRALARQFNGRLITALSALGAAIPEANMTREEHAQAGVALAAAVVGLMLFDRSGILGELGLKRARLIDTLSARFARP